MTTTNLQPVNCGCGGEAHHDSASCWNPEEEEWTPNFWHRVICKNCGTQTKAFYTEAEAITAWNRAMGTENICKNCKAYFVMGDCGYCKYDDEYPTADGYGCNCFSRRES